MKQQISLYFHFKDLHQRLAEAKRKSIRVDSPKKFRTMWQKCLKVNIFYSINMTA